MGEVADNDCWISLLSGAKFNYNKPEESDVTIEDMASALSNVCRFSGHLPRFYSVAQHLVNASRIVPPEHAFTALMHDTAEAFTNDLPTPLKWTFPIFKELEASIESAMGKKFGFEYPFPPMIKDADTIMLILEKRFVKGDESVWPNYEDVEKEILKNVDGLVDSPVVYGYTGVNLDSWQPRRAKREFLKRFEELNNERVESLRRKAA